VSNTRPAGRIRPTTSFYVAPDGLKDTWSPFLRWNFWKISYPIFEGFKLIGFFVIILEICSYVQYFYTQINNNRMQRELFNNMFGSSLYRVSGKIQPWCWCGPRWKWVWHPWSRLCTAGQRACTNMQLLSTGEQKIHYRKVRLWINDEWICAWVSELHFPYNKHQITLFMTNLWNKSLLPVCTVWLAADSEAYSLHAFLNICGWGG